MPKELIAGTGLLTAVAPASVDPSPTLPSQAHNTVGFHSTVFSSTVTVRSASLRPQNGCLRRQITRDASTTPSIDRIRLQFRRLNVAENAIARH